MPKEYITPQKKWKNDPVWDYFWTTALILTGFAIIVFHNSDALSKNTYIINISISFVLSLILVYFSAKYQTDGFSFKIHVASHIGRYLVHGKENKKSFYLIMSFGVAYAFFLSNIAHFFMHYLNDVEGYAHLKRTAQVLYIASVFLVLTSIIPLDIHRWKHLFSALNVFIDMYIISVFLSIYSFIYNRNYLVITTLLIQLLFSNLYIYGYISGKHPAIFQKFAMLFSTISLYLFILQF